MAHTANFKIVKDEPGKPLIIRDLGPWDQFMTVTNAAEWVVEKLVFAGRLPAGRRLFYYDSEGGLGELLVKNGRFDGFAYLGETDVAAA